MMPQVTIEFGKKKKKYYVFNFIRYIMLNIKRKFQISFKKIITLKEKNQIMK